MCSPLSLPVASVLLQCSSRPVAQTTNTPREKVASNVTELHHQPLLQSCLKRQLVGSQVSIESDEKGDPPSLQVVFDQRIWTFLVRSIGWSNAPNVPFGSKGIILPSTKITFESSPSAETDASLSTISATKEPTNLYSPTVRSLVQTIHLLRRLAHNGLFDVPRTFLLSGPPGVGKTHAVRCAVQEGNCHLLVLQGSQILGGGGCGNAAAKRLERQFINAIRTMRRYDLQQKEGVTLIFLDECDALLASPEEASSVGIIASTFARLLDEMSASPDPVWRRLIVVAATNRVDMIPSTLRRPGRFDREVTLSPPDVNARIELLKSLLGFTPVNPDCAVPRHVLLLRKESDIRAIAEACVGYVPADLAALVRRVELLHLQRCFASDRTTINNPLASSLSSRDLWEQAMSEVGASALRDAALQAPPTTTWENVAGDPGGAKTALRRAMEWPRTHREHYQRLGLTAPRGILLHGPPGCAKTTLARAAAGASAVSFFSFSPADVYSTSYVGDAEAVIRRAFTLARSAAPSVLFFDELDALVGTDGHSSYGGLGRGSSGSATEARVLSTFLNEMDGVDGSWQDGVLVLGATNRPWTLDAALLRPGRFDKIIYVPPPDYEGRRAIFAMHCSQWCRHVPGSTATATTIDLDFLASESVSGNMTGAEIVGACREAAMLCIRQDISHPQLEEDASTDPSRQIEEPCMVMKEEYLITALKNVRPLLSNPEVLQEFESFPSRRRS